VLDALELSARRIQEKLTQADFAKKLGISQSYLTGLERGLIKVSDKLEKRYDRLYPKRLTSITFKRGIECPKCHGTSPLEKLSEPKDELNTVWHCTDCGYYFTTGESWQMHYRP